MLRTRKKDVIIVVDVGAGIFIRLPGYEQGRLIKGARIADVIQKLDEFGIGVPIFFVQALGRGTFNGRKSVLKENGNEYVKVLTDKDDFTAAHKYVNFFDHFVGRIRLGNLTEDALAGASG